MGHAGLTITAMNTHRAFVASALAAALASPVLAHQAEDLPGKERCYGVAKAGENHCANLAATHDCAGQSTVDRDPGEWMYVPKGSCRKLKGLNEAQARAKLGLKR